MQTTQSPARNLQLGLDAQAQGDFSAAHEHYLQAAKLLFAEARSSTSTRLRQQRYEQGQKVMERAKAISAQVDVRRQQQESARRQVPPEKADEDLPNWLLSERPDLRLDDVAGLEEVKEQIHLKLIYPFSHRAAAERFGVRPGGGLLLYGPPGTGKTYIARAIAGELEAAFFVARSSDLMSQWFGKAEQNIAALFAAARKEETSVIFLDEVEALVPKRSSNRSSVMPRVVSEFLAQTQSIGNEGGTVLLMGATNEPWAIDPAALRPGRFDELIYVGLPDLAARQRLLELNLGHRPLAPDVDVAALAIQLAGYSGADIAYICTKASERAFLDAVENALDRDIGQADFLAILAERGPSVSPEQLRKYENFQAKQSGQ